MATAWTTIVKVIELTLAGAHARTIGERFFTAGTAIVLGSLLFAGNRVAFVQELPIAVGAESVVALIALILKRVEARR